MTDRNPQGPITRKCSETGKSTMMIAFNSVVFCSSAWAFVTILLSHSFQFAIDSSSLIDDDWVRKTEGRATEEDRNEKLNVRWRYMSQHSHAAKTAVGSEHPPIVQVRSVWAVATRPDAGRHSYFGSGLRRSGRQPCLGMPVTPQHCWEWGRPEPR